MHENPVATGVEACAVPGAGYVVLRYVAGGAHPSRAGRDRPELLHGEHKHPVEGVDVIKRAFMVQGLFTPG